jgi:hypothetical protein
MKKKCVGCGKSFQDTISICNECLLAIQNTREQINPLPRKNRLSGQLFGRKLVLWVTLINIILIFQVPLLVSTQVLPPIIKETGKHLLLGGFIYNLPVIILSLFGFFMGSLFNKAAIKNMLGIWANKEFYTRSNWFLYLKYWLPASRRSVVYLIIFILSVFLIFYFITPLLLSWALKAQSVYGLIFSSGLMLGSNLFIFTFVIGFNLAYYFSTNWMTRLSK